MKFLIKVLVALIIHGSLSSDLFAQTSQWVKYGKSQGFEYGNDITTDDSGNVYVVGQYEYITQFGSVSIPSAGQHDIFVAKYNTDGVLKWIKSAGGKEGDAGSAIALDGNRNVYITGEFEVTAKFSPTDSITSGGSNDIYLAKYNNNGGFLWVKRFGGSGDCRGRAIAVDAAGYAYISGSFSGTATFGGSNLTSAGNLDIFVAKYTPSGVRVWSRRAGGTREDRGRGLTLDGLGNLYITTSFTQSATFSTTTLTDATGSKFSAALAKYDTSGNFSWVRAIGGCCDTTRAYGPSTDASGNVYITGYFTDETRFGTTILNGSGNTDAFIAKYNTSGTLQWAKKYGGLYEDFGNGSVVDKRHQLVYFTGMFDYRADFDSINVFSAGNRDIWVSAVNYSGEIQWLKTAGGKARDAGYEIAVDTSGNIYHTGFTNDTAYFGTDSVVGFPLADYYVSKLSPAVTSQPVTAASLLNASLTNCINAQLTWTSGSGANRIVIARAGSAVNVFPADGALYSANSVFGSGTNLGSNNFVVYNGASNSVTITGLSTGVTYHFAVIEYNGYNVFTNYNTQNYPVANLLTNSFNISASSSQGSICPGDSSILSSGGAVSYSWTPSTGLSATTGVSVIARPTVTTTYTVTGTNAGGCQAASQVVVTVLTPPAVTFAALNRTCINGNSITLSGGSPTGGIYSGTGVSGGSFNPATAGVGSHIITYSYQGGNGCNATDTSIQHVHALPSVSLGTFASVCQTSAAFTLTGGSPSGGVYSGPGVSGGQFSPGNAGVGTHTITYTYTNSNGCVASTTASIIVIAPQVVTLANFSATCLNTPAFALTGGSPAGGTYSGPGVSAGSFNPSSAGVGTHTITYTVSGGGGCSGVSTATLQVQALPTVTLAAIADICSASSPMQLSGGSPVGGVYSGNGVSSGFFDPGSVGAGTYPITYTYTAASSCSNSAQRNILVKSSPTVTLSPLSSVCLNSSSFVLSGGSPAGGTYSGTGVSAGSFSPTTAGAGTHIITYTYTAANGCIGTATSSIVVITPQVVTLGSFNSVCLNTPGFALSGGSPVGGVYSGTGVSGGMFDASVAGVGSHTITYAISGGGGCAGTSSSTIQVLALPTVSLNTFSDICSNASPLQLSGGSPAGGIYSGNGVSAGFFNPTTVGAGTYAITYTITGANSCSNNAQRSIIVKPAPSVSISSMSPVCFNTAPYVLTGATPSGGTWSGPGVTGSNFSPANAGVGIHTISYSYTAANACSNSASTPLQVLTPPVVSLASLNSTCSNSTPYVLTGGLPVGGEYSGPGVVAGMFNPASAGTGTHNITYTYASAAGCAGSATSSLQVIAPPVASFAALPDICENASPISLSGGSPVGGTYSGNGVSLGLFNPSAVGSGSVTITYTYTVSSTCSSSAQQSITVKSAPSVSLSAFNSVCVNSAPLALSGGLPVGGTYTGTGVNSGVFDPGVGSGSFTITYTVNAANGCAGFASQSIQVNALPNVSLNFFSAACTNSSQITLSGGSPVGGNYSGTGVNAGVFNPSIGPGTYQVTYSYTDLNFCTGTASNPILVNTSPTVTLSALADVCSNASPILLQGGSPSGGQYTGTSVTSGRFDPAVGAGTYTISYEFTDVNGCSDSTAAPLLVLASPSIDLGNDTLLCANSILTLDAGTGFSSVQWSTGQTQQSIDIDSVDVGFGFKDISVQVSNAEGCLASDTIRVTFDACAGIGSNENSMPGVYLYPNPFSSSVRLLSERPIQISVFDVSGRLLERRENVLGSIETGQNLAAGTYFIEVTGNGYRKIFHVIKANR
ncbi:MAG: T9SS type A sorting domain-containing protein [Bacteroidia bacterium]|nr:T9SS type A sorting domain-containing protein [Bacteroidia bacterium]